MGITDWKITLYPNEEEDEIMQLRRDEMAIRNMMQMKQAGYEASLRDGIDDKILHFDFKQPDPQEVAAAEAQAAAAQQQQGGQAPVQKTNEIDDDPSMMFKRTTFDSSRGSIPINASLVTTAGTDLPPLRTQSENTRRSGGTSPDMIDRVEGAPTGASVKTDKRSLKTPQEKAIDENIRQKEKRNGLGESRGNSQ